MPSPNIQFRPEIFDEYTRRQYVAKAPQRNPFGTDETPKKFAEFDVFTKLRVLFQLSQWTLLNPDRIREKMLEAKDTEQTQWVSSFRRNHHNPWLKLCYYSALRRLATIKTNGFTSFSMTIDSTDEQTLPPLLPLLQNQKLIREEARPRPGQISEEKPWRRQD